MGDAGTDNSFPVVILTGFGPFGHHKINASWEAVKKLRESNIEAELKIKLVTAELPVEYDFVESEIPKLWREHNPKLVIHVGVSSYASRITLETQARRTGYIQTDNCGRLPILGSNCLCDEECLQSSLDVSSLSVTASENAGIPICTSTDAGRYLCEYTFFSSLSQDKSKALFIHVPELDKPFSAEQLAAGIKGVVKELLDGSNRI